MFNGIDNVNGISDMKTEKYSKQVNFYIKDIEEEFHNDMESGNGFIITDKLGIDKGERTARGIYSPEYGSIWQDDNAFQELYSCECKDMQGKMYDDMVCPKCGTRVKYKDKNIKMTGYLILDNYHVIHPTLYRIIGSLIGGKKLNSILYPAWETDSRGKWAEDGKGKPIIDEKTRNINKYDRIGLIEFEKRFDEIIEFFYQKRKHKKAEYEFIKKHRDKVFTSYIQVISLILRPIILGDEDFSFAPINREYSILSSKVYDLNHKFAVLNETNEKIVVTRLYEIIQKYDKITKKLAQALNKKQGQIRNGIHGARYNFSTRGVIRPMSTGKTNETDFPYMGFLIMYRPEIMSTIIKLNNVTINEAYSMWLKATVRFDKRIYKIMEYMVSRFDVYILLNRNPTINYGGIMRMKIRKVKSDYNDLTIDVPINALGAYAADFDGDALNSISLKDAELVKAYKLFDPRSNMIISKNDGLFDNNFNLIKDQLICLHQFCKFGRENTVHMTIKRVKEEAKESIDIIEKPKNDGVRKIKIKRIKE